MADQKQEVERIGVFNYQSLLACLNHTHERIFGEPMRDPQDAIQRMEAEINALRRKLTA